MNRGVEWALHSCLNLGWLDRDRAVTGERLAAFYDLPPAYLNKQLQALTRAGILASVSGPRGGFRLARRLGDITLLDVVVAIEGHSDAFMCGEILRHGPGGDPATDYRESCIISQAMIRAETQWRQALAAETLADIRSRVETSYPQTASATRAWFENVRRPLRDPAPAHDRTQE